ncbi:MAG TPA: hypothetical protein VI197_17480 [Polyangiaceae bacterium]
MKSDSRSLAAGESLRGFFEDTVASAAARRGSTTTDAVRGYLAGLLSDFARPDTLVHDTLSRPLTLLLYEANSASGFERFERLRTLGDGVLYVAGFFRDHITHRGVELSYVNALGAQAYGGASRMLKRPTSRSSGSGDDDQDIFSELSDNFHEFAELLFEIAEVFHTQAVGVTPRATVHLYERWLKTGSNVVVRALCERGIVPLKGTDTLH